MSAEALQGLLASFVQTHTIPGEKPPEISELDWSGIKRLQDRMERFQTDETASRANSAKESELQQQKLDLLVKKPA